MSTWREHARLAAAFDVSIDDVAWVLPRDAARVLPTRGGCLCLAVGCDGARSPCPIAPTTRCVHCGSRDPSRWPACASCQRGSERLRPVTADRIVERIGYDPRPSWNRRSA